MDTHSAERQNVLSLARGNCIREVGGLRTAFCISKAGAEAYPDDRLCGFAGTNGIDIFTETEVTRPFGACLIQFRRVLQSLNIFGAVQDSLDLVGCGIPEFAAK